MELDTGTLGRFIELASLGADSAAGDLTRMAGIDFDVEDAAVSLVTFDEIRTTFRDRDRVALKVMFEGELSGKAMLAIDEDTMERVVAGAMPDSMTDDDALRRSAVTEVGNVVLGGFINGWADHLGERVELRPTKYVEDPGLDDLPMTATLNEQFESALAFTSTLASAEEDVDVSIYMFPTRASITFSDLTDDAGTDRESFDLEQLFAFNAMSNSGAANAAGKLTEMTDVAVDIDVARLTFVPTETLPVRADETTVVGTVLEFTGPPDGYVAILFDGPSAATLVEQLRPSASTDEITPKYRGTVEEVGNIMSSGFVDGWANVLGRTIRVSPPDFVHDRAPAVLSSVGGLVGRRHEHALVHDSTVVTSGHHLNCDVFAIPESDGLDGALASIPVDVLGDAGTDLDAALETNSTYDELR
jgi:chemotaxis protein CheC